MASQFFILSGITLLAYFIKGITGFGNTLVMNSLFGFVKENRFTTPVDLLLGTPANIYLAWKNRKNINFRVVLPLALAVLAGNIPGILLLKTGSDHLLKVILGLVLIFLSIDMLRVPSPQRGAADRSRTGTVSLWIIGLVSGFLMGLYGIGALLATYIARHADNRCDYRGNLCFVFGVDNLFRLGGYWFQGILNRQIGWFFLWLVPAAGCGMLLSAQTDQRFSDALVKRFVLILLAGSGLILILKNIPV